MLVNVNIRICVFDLCSQLYLLKLLCERYGIWLKETTMHLSQTSPQYNIMFTNKKISLGKHSNSGEKTK